MEQSISQLIAQLQCQMPHLHFPTPFPQFPKFNPQVDLNAKEEDEDEELEND